MDIPNTTATNGRFKPGNKAAAGHSTKSQKLRAAMLKAVSESDVRAIVKALVLKARDGDMDATKILFGFIGKPVDAAVAAVPVLTPDEKRAKLASLLERIEGRRAEAAQPG